MVLGSLVFTFIYFIFFLLLYFYFLYSNSKKGVEKWEDREKEEQREDGLF